MPSIKSLNYDDGSHPSETHSHSPPSPSSSPRAPGIPSSPHSPSHILPSFVDTYNLPPAPSSQQHGNITIPSTTILAHRHGQYSPITQASASQINGGNRTIITTIPRQTTLESRFTTFKTEPNLSPSPQPRGISAENISFGHQQYTQSGQLVTAPSTSPSPYSTNTHPVNILSYQQQQTTGQSNIARGQCNSYETPSLNFLKKVILQISSRKKICYSFKRFPRYYCFIICKSFIQEEPPSSPYGTRTNSGVNVSEYYHSSPPNPPALFSTNFTNEPSSTATSGDYDSSLIRTSEAQTTISSLYHDEHYTNVTQISSSSPTSSLPATLQGALQGALMSHEGSSRRGGHHQSHM